MTIYKEAEQVIYFLSLPEAHERKGKTWCTLSALMLTMIMSSYTQLEAQERLVKQIADIKTKLEGKE